MQSIRIMDQHKQHQGKGTKSAYAVLHLPK